MYEPLRLRGMRDLPEKDSAEARFRGLELTTFFFFFVVFFFVERFEGFIVSGVKGCGG